MPAPSAIFVRCPHCQSPFVVDPEVETVTNAPRATGTDEDDTPITFFPACPSCHRRVKVTA